MYRKIVGVIGAALVAVMLIAFGPTNPAGAKPIPPGKRPVIVKTYKPIPRPFTQAGMVWVTAQAGLGAASGVYATGFWEGPTTKTNFTGVKTSDALGWADTPCPASVGELHKPCLRVVWGTMAEGVYGKYEPLFCTGGCVKQGVITVNRWGPYFCDPRPVADGGNACPYDPGYGVDNPWNRATIVTHFFGRFIGLTTHPTRDCTSVMSASAWTCAPPRPGDDWLTDSEAAAVAVW